jgi:S1-C subfamily serine protease
MTASRDEGVGPSPNLRRRLFLVALSILVLFTVGVAGLIVGLNLEHGDRLATSAADTPDLSGNESSSVNRSTSVDPTNSPSDVRALIKSVSGSVVWVECRAGVGTGWVIDTAARPNLRQTYVEDYDPEAMVLVVTAEHVVRSCVKNDETPAVYVGERRVSATLLNWRKKTDIALLAISAGVPGLQTTVMTPQAAWALSVGFPWEFEKAVPLIGHVIDRDSNGLLVQMVVQPGNSGSPVVNSQGQVMGTVVAALGEEGEDYSLGWTSAVPIDALCGTLFLCDQVSITSPVTRDPG